MATHLTSVLCCPSCGREDALTMPTDACLFFHQCAGCDTILRPKPGDCCVFCSYGSVPCPPMQEGTDCCGDASGATDDAVAAPTEPTPLGLRGRA